MSSGDSTSKKTTKIAIPHTAQPEIAIAGILEQVAPTEPTSGRKIALVRKQRHLHVLLYCMLIVSSA